MISAKSTSTKRPSIRATGPRGPSKGASASMALRTRQVIALQDTTSSASQRMELQGRGDPSGNLLHSNGKSPFLMGKSTIDVILIVLQVIISDYVLYHFM